AMSFSCERVFHYFKEICKIPHGSGETEKIAEYCVKYAEKQGLRCLYDDAGNVIIYADGTCGLENKAPVVLQGHLDMVCEKTAECKKDMSAEGIDVYEKDGWLTADGTTLGGDDGIAVAMMLALAIDESISCPKLEFLFTVSEETGMDGANGFDYSCITADKLINLDYEGEGAACTSCAGGEDSTLTFECDTIPFQNKAISIKVFGLAGGHSGADIDKNRLSANRVMGLVLERLYDKMPFNLISVNGGSKRNAIARECEAIISVFDADAAKEEIKNIGATVSRDMISSADRGFRIHVNKAHACDTMMTFAQSASVIDGMFISPHGIVAMSSEKEGMVEASTNLGVITTENNTVVIHFMSRSSVESQLDRIKMNIDRVAVRLGAKAEHSGRYPGWKFKKCPLQQSYLDTFSELFGKEGHLDAIHAGLECGIITSGIAKAQNKEIDAIAIGPNLYDIHSPDERMELASCERTYKLVCALVEKKY
ncbi:MAG: beta-Ala-His dipeptidase, partial [Clostridia bacterium]|nr:beta-Ala-His dipeptidase [Clostridia bacterium]